MHQFRVFNIATVSNSPLRGGITNFVSRNSSKEVKLTLDKAKSNISTRSRSANAHGLITDSFPKSTNTQEI